MLDGVWDLFCLKLERSLDERVTRLIRALTKPPVNPATNKPRPGLPVFLRLYKCCFKWVLERYGDGGAAAAEDRASLKELVADFEGACAALLQERGNAQGGQRAAPELERAVERLCLRRHLDAQQPGMPSVCATRQQRLPPDSPPPVLDAGQALEVVGRLCSPGHGSGGAGVDRALLAAQLGRLAVLGGAPEDASALFHAVAQLLVGQRAARGAGARGRALPALAAGLRSLAAKVALGRYEGPEQAERFRKLWEDGLRLAGAARGAAATVEEWAGRMMVPSVHGDVVALDALAYHYKLDVLLYTPASPGGPLALPVRALKLRAGGPTAHTPYHAAR